MKSSSCHVDASAARGGRAIPIRTEAPRLHVWLNICSSALQLCSNKWANKRGGRWNDQIFHFKAFVSLVLSFTSFLKCLGMGKRSVSFFNSEGHITPFIRWMTKIRSPVLSAKDSLLSKPLKLHQTAHKHGSCLPNATIPSIVLIKQNPTFKYVNVLLQLNWVEIKLSQIIASENTVYSSQFLVHELDQQVQTH